MEKAIIEDHEFKSIIDVPLNGIAPISSVVGLKSEVLIKLSEDPRFQTMLIPADVITKRVDELAKEIILKNLGVKKFNFLMVLTGAFTFTADLSRAVFNANGPEINIHTMKLSTYRREIKKEGECIREVDIQLDCNDLEDQDIIIVEDIIDQGFTLAELKNFLLNTKKVKSVQICTLLYKKLKSPTKEVQDIREQLHVDYVGFSIPDVWVAGYGIDSGEDFRELPCVIAVNEKFYLSRS